MSRKRHEQIGSIFNRARRLEGDERLACLQRECAGDAELLAEVQSLLDEEASPGLETGQVRAQVARAASHSRDAGFPERIGRYHILRVIGEGGMGVVYEAEQDDPRRSVALKVIRPELVDPAIVSRFRREAQLLGRLRHPGIAQIFEAGTSDDSDSGQPFFAMELVDGLPLPEYAEREQLDTRGRIELLARVCDALEHAHQQGIVHRDLKPANVLVEQGERPKVLDFGVARAIGADVHTVSPHTRTGQIVGTLPYMSPEQASGDPGAIDGRSDVYSVGVIAYELFAGQLPYDVRNRPLHEAVRVIREEDPSRLSAVRSNYRGDIETIVGKALEKEKARRYQSAGELAADLRRHLRDEPIVARPASALYQLGKFARRNKILVAALGVIAVILVVATVVSTAAAVNERKAAELAEQRRIEAERQTAIAGAVNEFLNEDLLSAVSPDKQGRDVTMLEVLETAAENIGDRFSGQPEVEAEIRYTIGNTYLALGDHDRAKPFFVQALKLRETALGELDPKTIQSYNGLGRLMIRMGNLDQAETYFTRCLELRERTLGYEYEETLITRNNLAGLLRQLGRVDEAMELYRVNDEITARLLEPEDEVRMSTVEGLAGAYKDLQRPEDAIPLYQQVLDVHQRLSVGKPSHARAMNNLAVAYLRAEHFEEAGELLQQAAEAFRETLGDEHPSTLATTANYARASARLGDYDRAERLFTKAVETSRRINGPDHRGTLIMTTYYAEMCRELGRNDEAEAMLLQVHRLALARYGELFPATRRSAEALIALYDETGRAAEADRWRERSTR